jgi:hypothetical protein
MHIAMTPQDDLIGHQTPQPFAKAGNGDSRFTERYWYTAHPIDGTELLIDIGLGYYPNRGVMDAFAGVTVGRKQHNFRVSRQLGNNPLETTIGVLKIEVIEGGKLHHLTLDENKSGISFDLRFEARFPVAPEKQSYRERKGAVEEDLARVAQFGRWSGWLVVNGNRTVVQPEGWWGQRDHSWGIRSEMRTDETKPPVQTHKGFFWTWSMFQFEDMGISIFLKERAPGEPGYLSGTEFRRDAHGAIHAREITMVTHDIQWADDPLGQTIEAATWRLEFNEGAPRELRMEGLPTRFYLKGGNYGGFKGWNHGDDVGPLHSDQDVWDLDDAATRLTARTLGDHLVRVTTDGRIGSGVSEYGVAAGYPRYEAPQRHAAL